MLIKIKRQDCLKQFPKFPQREYDEKEDEEIFLYPLNFRTNWFDLPFKNKNQLNKMLAEEITNLTKTLKFDSLIFLGDTNFSWITKSAIERNDYLPLKRAIQYFLKNKVGVRFNGGLDIPNLELPEFIKHFYCLTRTNAALPYFHFMDKGQNLIGFIHYSGEVQFSCLNKTFYGKFSKAILNTKFQQNDRQ